LSSKEENQNADFWAGNLHGGKRPAGKKRMGWKSRKGFEEASGRNITHRETEKLKKRRTKGRKDNETSDPANESGIGKETKLVCVAKLARVKTDWSAQKRGGKRRAMGCGGPTVGTKRRSKGLRAWH